MIEFIVMLFFAALTAAALFNLVADSRDSTDSQPSHWPTQTSSR